MPEITLCGQAIPYTVRESRRARSLRILVSPKHGLEVVIPAGAATPDIQAVLLSRAAWIVDHYQRVQEARVPERQWISGERLPYLGHEVVLEVTVKTRGKRASVLLDADRLRVSLPAGTAAGEPVRAALEAWYRAQARDHIARRAAELADQHGFRFQRVTIKGQSTRWGSCSSHGNLNFNWRLMMAPPAAVDYVIIHELCHLREMNHSRRFWSLVAGLCPDYKRWVKWLKLNGPRLNL